MTPRRQLARTHVYARLLLLLLLAGLAPARAQSRATPAELEKVHEYIRRSWHTLTRSNRGLAAAAVDPKFKPAEHPARYRWPVYVARDENLEAITRGLRAEMTAGDFARIELRRLP